MTKPKYPANLLRITGLEGGQYGTIDVIARAHDMLELNYGGDFSDLSRTDVEALIDALQRFLAMGHEHAAPKSDRPRHHRHANEITVTERVEERVEVTAPAPRRKSRRQATSERAER